MDLLIPLLLLAAAGLALLVWLDAKRQVTLQERLIGRILDDEDEEDESLWRDAANLLQVARMQRLLGQSPIIRRLSMLLIFSDLRISLPQAILLFVVVTALGAGLGYAYEPVIWTQLAGGLLAPLGLWHALSSYAAARVDRRERQLTSFVTQMLSALRSGATPLSALQSASRVTADPLGASLRALLDSLQLGVAPQVAWKEWAGRCGGQHADMLATGIRLKWDAGGQMTSMLQHILDSMNAREKMILRVGTLTAQAKIGSVVLTILPILFLLFSYKANPRIFQFMINDPIGVAALWIGAGLLVVGFFWLRWLAKLEF